MTHEWIRWLLVSVVVGAVALPAGNVIAGDWMSPWPAYQLQDASGTPGYHRMHMTWSPFSSNYTFMRPRGQDYLGTSSAQLELFSMLLERA